MSLSNLLFGNDSILSILDTATPDNRKDLKRRTFHIRADHTVNTGKTPMGGTFIEITKN